ncbi:hypothetical protein [Arthrobacter globiformis]|uniref:hypothetical protein n=1 Tax=Arthrobacter globiformis TaxID=1665 RepID=UPI002788E5BC|nr:hypothetical protein [Arthrobacter globiformis]MDQ0865712.1 hypothetical protein [Arthrobacter globiformis]
MRNGEIATVSLLAAVMLVLAGCGGSSAERSSSNSKSVNLTSEVLYEVEGTQESASVTYETPTGTSQADLDIPMKRKSSSAPGLLLTFNTGEFVYISAQGRDSSGSVRCRITVDGTVISENIASGYGIATCKGTS